MNRTEQYKINCEVIYHFNNAVEEYNTPYKTLCDAKKLRSCTAVVIETENYYILRSYRTLIACIDKRTDTLYDALRHEYGYTSTSGQHIAKFRQDYGAGKWGCEHSMTWRSL